MEDILEKTRISDQRKTQKEKNANNNKWYRDQADLLDIHSSLRSSSEVGGVQVTDYMTKKVNYDLFNNELNLKDLAYVCQPFGADGGELPANMTNKDIVSPKIKVLLGMEMNMPFDWKVYAVNEEATTRKEQKEFQMIQQWVVNEIMKPIRTQLEQQQAQQTKGKPLTPEEQQQIQQQIEQELQSKTPEEVKKYMTREHQDPAEVMMHQILEYLIQEQQVAQKFNKGFKHSLLGGNDLYYIGTFNNKPSLNAVDNIRFKYDRVGGADAVEDGQWATCEYRWTPSEIMSKFGSELTKEEVKKVYNYSSNSGSAILDETFTFDNRANDFEIGTIRVLHATWKGEMKVGFLIYNSVETGKEEMMLVDENYKLNKQAGDISIQWEWISETHETWKIMADIYVYCRPVPGQHKDIDRLWEAKLPYYGSSCDSLNSPVTSAMDRIKTYQYYYNIIMYRIEMLMASDKGKKLLMNIKAIPKSAKIDTKKWLYYMEANNVAFYSNSEEGMRGQNLDAGSIAKEIDMSLASSIKQYIDLAEYIESKCGAAIGVTKAMEGAIGPTDAVTNTKQNLVQASYIVKPYFELHNVVKGRVLKALVETAKVVFSTNPPQTLSYVLDDMSLKMLTVDQGLLDSSTYGFYISNSGKAEEAKNAIIQLSQAAMQNQQIDLLDVVKIIKSQSMNEAEEQLTVSYQNKQEQLQSSDNAKLQQQKEADDLQRQHEREQWKHEADMIILKAGEDRKTKLQVEAMAAMGFDPNKDEDGDGEPDILEIYKHGLDAEIKRGQLDQNQEHLDLEKDKFNHQQKIDNKKIEQEDKKIQISKTKKTNT